MVIPNFVDKKNIPVYAEIYNVSYKELKGKIILRVVGTSLIVRFIGINYPEGISLQERKDINLLSTQIAGLVQKGFKDRFISNIFN